MELESDVKKRLTKDIHKKLELEKSSGDSKKNENNEDTLNDKLKFKFDDIDIKDINLEDLQKSFEKLLKDLDVKKIEKTLKKKKQSKEQ